MQRFPKILKYALFSTLLITSLGCPSAEIAATTTALEAALTAFTQNRALTEQFVRDVKATVKPDTAEYLQAMESYQDARDTYNRYLDAVESGSTREDGRSTRACSPREVINTAADFLASATEALKPSVNTRRIAFQRAIIVPNDLEVTLQRLPKRERRKLTDSFDDQVRWRKWSEL